MQRKRMIELAAISGLLIAARIFIASDASASETINYSYDAKGRLILVQHSGTVNNNVVANYSFDPADNRTNVKVTGAP